MPGTLPKILSRSALAVGVAALIAGAQATAAPSSARSGADEAKWFVLHEHRTPDCWTGKLIRIGGAYAPGSALIAGGPYKSKAAAQTRMAALRASGTCRAE